MNITSMSCTKNDVFVRGANGTEWTMTRAQILAIYQTKTGSAASRKQATITDVLVDMETTLGKDIASSLLASLDFDPLDSTKDMILTLSN